MRYQKIIILLAVNLVVCLNCHGTDEDKKSMDNYDRQREIMVEQQLLTRDIVDELVLEAMNQVPRHLFVPEKYRTESYRDGPLPIGNDQTISQPYIVASMTQLAKIDSSSKVLEIGTGSGYQAAVLGEIADSVFSIEIIESLADNASMILDSLHYHNVYVKFGDGYLGWPEHAPFDAIIVTAAAPKIPQPLIDQLAIGGRMVIPVGDSYQELKLITKNDSSHTEESIYPVRFVPMTGEIRKK